MLFITNRFPTQGIPSELGRIWDFDLKNTAASNSVFYCERYSNKSYTDLGSKPFLERINVLAHSMSNRQSADKQKPGASN
jgi:hypothetical protein